MNLGRRARAPGKAQLRREAAVKGFVLKIYRVVSWAPDELGVLGQACPALLQSPPPKKIFFGQKLPGGGEVKRPNLVGPAPIVLEDKFVNAGDFLTALKASFSKKHFRVKEAVFLGMLEEQVFAERQFTGAFGVKFENP